MIRCVCGGRGWVMSKDSEWWNYCPVCSGRGVISHSKLAKWLGITSTTLKKIENLEKVRLSKLTYVLDKLLSTMYTVNRRPELK